MRKVRLGHGASLRELCRGLERIRNPGGERPTWYRVLWLDLRLVGASDSPRVPLSHRLKDTYRKQRNDLGSRNGRGLVPIEFKPIHGNEGVWEIPSNCQERGHAIRLFTTHHRVVSDYSPPG